MPRCRSSVHPGAKKALAEIWNAEDKRHALDAVKKFEAAYSARYPKAVAKITDDVDQLLAFYDYPAEHWVHLRTTNPIESTFATVRNRTKITKGRGSRAAGIAMAYKLIEAAQARWRAVNAPHLVALVGAGGTFNNGKTRRTPRRNDHEGGRCVKILIHRYCSINIEQETVRRRPGLGSEQMLRRGSG